MYDVVKKAVKDLKIGDDIKIQRISDVYRVNDRENIQRQILEETQTEALWQKCACPGFNHVCP